MTDIHIITLIGNSRSLDAARQCADSAAENGVSHQIRRANTPDTARSLFTDYGYPTERFDNNPYSRPEPTMAAFLSHAALWRHSAEYDESLIVCEHDAVWVSPPPDDLPPVGLVNLGHPSYGNYKQPKIGIGPLTSKRYLPGAHAYYITPSAAKELLQAARTEAEPTDVFINLDRFPWLQEAYPWSVVCRDSFTTIQRELGCRAKHNEVEVIDP